MKYQTRSFLCGLTAFVIALFFSGCSKPSAQVQLAEKALSEYVNKTFADQLKAAMISSVSFDKDRESYRHFEITTTNLGDFECGSGYTLFNLSRYSLSVKNGEWSVSGLNFDFTTVSKDKAVDELTAELSIVLEQAKRRNQAVASWSAPLPKPADFVWRELPDGE